MFRTTIGFETPNSSCLKIKRVPENNCFSYSKVLQNGVNVLTKMVLKKPVFFFLSKSSKYCTYRTIQYCSIIQISPACDQKSAFVTVAWKIFNGKFASKNDFPMGHFMSPLLTLTLEI